jgi:hypothetical protein
MSAGAAVSPDHEPDEVDQPALPLAIEADGPGQLSFFSEGQEMEIKGLSTGEGLFQRDRRLYSMVVHLLGQDAPIREIKRLTGLHHRTIMAVREREGETIDTLRKSLGRRALRTAALAVEALEEKIISGTIKAGELAMTAGILIDKGQVLTGGVTARTEAIRPESVEDTLRAALEALPSADARVIEGPANTGIGGGNLAAIGAGLVGIEGAGSGSDEASEDLQSSVSPFNSDHVASHVANPEDGEATDRDGAVDCDQGGGGGCDSMGGHDVGIDK